MGNPSQRDILIMNERKKILSFDNLEIGFVSGKHKNILLPPARGTAYEGELIAVIGKNGVGKSTLLRTMAGLQGLIDGGLSVDGRSIKEYSRIQLSEKVGYISTEIVKVSNMKVYDLVSLGRYPYTNWLGSINSADHDIITESLKKTGMDGFSERHVTELSDGERQRAMIAMVLAQNAEIMVMDEPTAFLDISSKFEIIHLMHELTTERNKTIIFSTHDLSTALSHADKIWVLKENGLFEGAPEDLMLEGTFNTLFDDSKVKFNTLDGSFSFLNVEKGQITVNGEGEKKYWTEKALKRAGYSIADSGSTIVVESPSEMNPVWKCHKPDSSKEFNNIYELVEYIRHEILIS
jgi:iron complex transport system ATP-binding protein